MITQCQIGPNFLMGILHSPTSEVKDISVLLLPGLSMSMCDVDYFMSRLARLICRNGMYVLQLDTRGHGDSPGNLENVTMNTLKEDVEDGINFLTNIASKNVYIIGRGFGASFAAQFVLQNKALGAVGIAPYCLPNTIGKQMWSNVVRENTYSGSDLLPGTEYRTLSDFESHKVAYFNALGVRVRNILGQRVNGDFLCDIMQYDIKDLFIAVKEHTLWLFHSDKTENNIKEYVISDPFNYLDLNEYLDHSFQRNPIWQQTVMKEIINWLFEKGEIYGNSISDK